MCTPQEPTSPVIRPRNGMDYEPKKTIPPDYSNVPNVRDWQMSPFSNERFDLDEIQKAEKLGYKHRGEVERLKKLYGYIKSDSDSLPKPPEDKSDEGKSQKKPKCTTELLYQPYGPSVVSSVSFTKPESNKPKLYGVLGPSNYSGFTFKRKSPLETPVPCQDFRFEAPKRDFRNVYIPYGPYGEIRFTPDMYVPMGPTILPNPR